MIFNPNNRLFTLARYRGRPPSVLTAIAVVLVTIIFVLIPSQILGRLVVRRLLGDQSAADLIVGNIAGFLPVFLALWVWLRLSSKRPFWTLGLEREHAIRRVLRGALIGGLMMVATAGIAVTRGAVVGPGLLQTKGAAALGIGFVSLMSYFVQGPAEEVLFRGWLLPVVGARYRPWVGMLTSALLLSLLHGLSPSITPLGFLNLFLFGIFAAVYALAEGGVWGIGAWHAVWNWTMGDFLGFAVDGTPHMGLLRSIRADGPPSLTGGAFGLEGGLACTAVFLLAIGMVLVLMTRTPDDTNPGCDQ